MSWMEGRAHRLTSHYVNSSSVIYHNISHSQGEHYELCSSWSQSLKRKHVFLACNPKPGKESVLLFVNADKTLCPVNGIHTTHNQLHWVISELFYYQTCWIKSYLSSQLSQVCFFHDGAVKGTFFHHICVCGQQITYSQVVMWHMMFVL